MRSSGTGEMRSYWSYGEAYGTVPVDVQRLTTAIVLTNSVTAGNTRSEPQRSLYHRATGSSLGVRQLDMAGFVSLIAWVAITLGLGVAIGAIGARTYSQRRAQQRDQDRERHWQQHYDARIETIEHHWQQRFDREREQLQALTDRLDALQSERAEIVETHQQSLRQLERDHQQAIAQQLQAHRAEIDAIAEQHKQAKMRSLNTSRSVIKGKIAEQLAPFLPGFRYMPSDARFLGEPVDYVVFDGYTEFKDGYVTENELEVVFVEVKTGKASLSPRQRALSAAIAAGRVRFETARIDTSAISNRSTATSNGAAPPIAPDRPDEYTSPSHDLKAKRQNYIRAYQPWLEDEDKVLQQRYRDGFTVRAIAAELQREPSAIRSRLRKLGLVDAPDV